MRCKKYFSYNNWYRANVPDLKILWPEEIFATSMKQARVSSVIANTLRLLRHESASALQSLAILCA
jgi:hypothetical protein